jgi:hypothetical protein
MEQADGPGPKAHDDHGESDSITEHLRSDSKAVSNRVLIRQFSKSFVLHHA